MKTCSDCQKMQNGICTETGRVPHPSASCDKWRYRYEPLVFAVERMRRIQRKRNKDWKDHQEQGECEQVVDKMLENIEKEGEIKP